MRTGQRGLGRVGCPGRRRTNPSGAPVAAEAPARNSVGSAHCAATPRQGELASAEARLPSSCLPRSTHCEARPMNQKGRARCDPSKIPSRLARRCAAACEETAQHENSARRRSAIHPSLCLLDDDQCNNARRTPLYNYIPKRVKWRFPAPNPQAICSPPLSALAHSIAMYRPNRPASAAAVPPPITTSPSPIGTSSTQPRASASPPLHELPRPRPVRGRTSWDAAGLVAHMQLRRHGASPGRRSLPATPFFACIGQARVGGAEELATRIGERLPPLSRAGHVRAVDWRLWTDPPYLAQSTVASKERQARARIS